MKTLSYVFISMFFLLSYEVLRYSVISVYKDVKDYYAKRLEEKRRVKKYKENDLFGRELLSYLNERFSKVKSDVMSKHIVYDGKFNSIEKRLNKLEEDSERSKEREC